LEFGVLSDPVYSKKGGQKQKLNFRPSVETKAIHYPEMAFCNGLRCDISFSLMMQNFQIHPRKQFTAQCWLAYPLWGFIMSEREA
jgi:hypothetical protein